MLRTCTYDNFNINFSGGTGGAAFPTSLEECAGYCFDEGYQYAVLQEVPKDGVFCTCFNVFTSCSTGIFNFEEVATKTGICCTP
jgi:hypothetical protein